MRICFATFVSCVFFGYSLSAETNDVSSSGEDDTPKDDMDCEICKTEMRRAILAIISLKKALKESETRAVKAERTLNETLSGTTIAYDETTGVYTATTCEGKAAQISCPEGKVMKVNAADYGRKDKTTCPHSQILTTECSTPKALKLVAKECASVKACAVMATNTVFDDPCVGTYKYLTINFSCTDATTRRYWIRTGN